MHCRGIFKQRINMEKVNEQKYLCTNLTCTPSSHIAHHLFTSATLDAPPTSSSLPVHHICTPPLPFAFISFHLTSQTLIFHYYFLSHFSLLFIRPPQQILHPSLLPLAFPHYLFSLLPSFSNRLSPLNPFSPYAALLLFFLHSV